MHHPVPSVSLALLLGVFAGCQTPVDPDDSGTAPTDPGPTDPSVERTCAIDLTCYGNILDDPKAPCAVVITDPVDGVLYDGAAAAELRGRSSLGFPKQQYAIELRDYTELPLWPGSGWRYADSGDDLGATWTRTGYDDAAWRSGPAPLGYDAPWLQTEIRPPAGDSLTTYARTTFTVQDRTRVTNLDVGVLRSGGVAVYVNGVEVGRDRLPDDALYDTPATSAPTAAEAAQYLEFDIDPGLIVAGDNVLAVELHQAAAGGEGLRFDAWLEASGDDHPVDLLGMGEDEDWILNGQYVDRALFRNRLAYDLYQSFGGADRYATESRFCELTLNGDYRGVYTLGENLERGDARLDLGKGTEPGDTWLIKLDDEYGFHENAIGYGTWQLEYPDPDLDAIDAVTADLVTWEAAVLGPDPAAADTGIFASLDLDGAVDWVIVNELMKNHDG
ncbi:MAG: CotH kinase family protein, partial [Myxococcota bacterium]